jgi:hypothetical protein
MGASPSLFRASSFHKWVCVYICGMQSFWHDGICGKYKFLKGF